eukprot:CAMPEP_0170063988 /NCGR_PEP_ID=MMETSP0019_2-20121128/4652_1 /TAXON_ID=98059 /ORGANISM="Dinobryon sp., Strain UTEXLB2267" /LENGTH=543 /DNA_ID=CAMNT_0010270561 /DNA_START=577 /DNA_END=2208 /DNA_ORIENTATION=-
MSPFVETMILDLDVVFFKSPHLLFRAPAYRETGALFFRDRVFLKPRGGNSGVKVDDLLRFFAYYHIQPNSTTSYTLLRESGVSLFWHYGLLEGEVLQDYQDSSVVLFNKANHPVTLQILERHLRDFIVGFGDKEFYWVAATAAREPFAFEPHLAGQYGDCAGVMLHFDPTHTPYLHYSNASFPLRSSPGNSSIPLPEGVTTYPPSTSHSNSNKPPEPFFINGEHLSEKEIVYVGQFFSDSITVPVPVHALLVDLLIQDLTPPGQRVVGFNTWQAKRSLRNCTCQPARYQCQPVPGWLTGHLLLAQWLVISTALHSLVFPSSRRNTPLAERVDGSVCVPMLVRHAQAMDLVFSRQLHSQQVLQEGGDCFVLGCPWVPLREGLMTHTWPELPSDEDLVEWGQYCEPISFSFAPLARAVMRPHHVRNGSSGNSSATTAVPSSHHFSATVKNLKMSSALSEVFTEGLRLFAEEARRPFSEWNRPSFPEGQLLQSEKDRRVFMLRNGSLHGFPGLSTFVNMGLDFENVIRLPKRQFDNYPIGDDLPTI